MTKFNFFFFGSSPEDMPTDFRERGREGKETSMGERNIRGLPLSHAPTRGQTCNLGMCPEWESNPWPFGLWEDAPTNWAILARAKFNIFKNSKKYIYWFQRERSGGREKHQCKRRIDWLPLTCTPVGNRTYNLGICSDWDLNQPPFGVQDDAPT